MKCSCPLTLQICDQRRIAGSGWTTGTMRGRVTGICCRRIQEVLLVGIAKTSCQSVEEGLAGVGHGGGRCSRAILSLLRVGHETLPESRARWRLGCAGRGTVLACAGGCRILICVGHGVEEVHGCLVLGTQPSWRRMIDTRGVADHIIGDAKGTTVFVICVGVARQVLSKSQSRSSCPLRLRRKERETSPVGTFYLATGSFPLERL